MTTLNIIFLILFGLGWLSVLILVAGETHAINNPSTKFTKWWRKHVIDNENKLK
jgi:hypothetical protein